MEKKLTPKQEKFILEYLVDLNGTQAAIRSGYSKKTANEQAARLLAKDSISTKINQKRAAIAKKTEISIEDCIREYKRIAMFDIRKAMDADGNLLPIHELDDDTAAAISGIESEDVYEGRGESRQKVGVLRKIKVADKRAALHDIMKNLGGFEKDNQQKGEAEAAAVMASLKAAKSTDEKSHKLKNLLKK